MKNSSKKQHDLRKTQNTKDKIIATGSCERTLSHRVKQLPVELRIWCYIVCVLIIFIHLSCGKIL